jgi:hypothetical protein
MGLRLNATLVKQYFQYRCDRQIRYGMLKTQQRQALGIFERSEREVWAKFGIDYEAKIISRLAQEATVLRPAEGEQLDEVETLAFLRGERSERYAHQARLCLTDPGVFRNRWGIDGRIELAEVYPDLIAARLLDGRRCFRIADVKAVYRPTLFHRTQVAYYSLLLSAILAENAIAGLVDPIGEIWHLHPDAQPGEIRWQASEFQLKGYHAQVADFLGGDLTRIASAELTPEKDATHFHLYFKCEQCKFLSHCQRAISDDIPRGTWDVSAVPGLSQGAKRSLVERQIRSIADLAARPGLAETPNIGWGLRTRGDALTARAAALLNRAVQRLPGQMTYRMPGHIDVGLYLLADHDPIEDRLAALGCLCEQGGQRDFTVAAVTSPGRAAEREALRRVLGALVAHLQRIDAHNAAGGAPLFAHLFLYEPAEAEDLQQALRRHLDDAVIREELLDLVRMFPPEPLHGEPEYGGRKHLPATALRDVLSALYALPVKVSYDLANVSAALAGADPPLGEPYRPTESFSRPFSSRLNIDACRALKQGVLRDEVEVDVKARLAAMASMVRWLLADNDRAAEKFLRLRKEPFRLQCDFHPLHDNDLGLLRAQELLAGNAGELAVLDDLARPSSERKAGFHCLGPLTLVEQSQSPHSWAASRLVFLAGEELRTTELNKDSFGVILSDGDYDLILDPEEWPGLFVTIAEVDTETGLVVVDVGIKAWREGTIEGLLAETPADGWYLDQARLDQNTGKLINFLGHLAGGDA